MDNGRRAVLGSLAEEGQRVRRERIETSDWRPEILLEFRDTWGLNQADMMRIFQRHGLEKINFSTYQRWQKGISVPRPAYRDLIHGALESQARIFRREGRQPDLQAAATGRLERERAKSKGPRAMSTRR